jgi:hypothetical protein
MGEAAGCKGQPHCRSKVLQAHADG